MSRLARVSSPRSSTASPRRCRESSVSDTPSVTAVHPGPGDLTLTSIVLFTLGAYGVAAGAATGQEAVVAVGVFAFTLFVIGIVWPVWSLSRLDVSAIAPTDATVGDALELRIAITGR